MPNPLFLLVRPAGFEPATYGFVVRRSVQAELRALMNFIEISLLIKLYRRICQPYRCINNMATRGASIRVSNKIHRNTPIFDFQPTLSSKDGGLFDAMLFTLWESRRTPDPALPRVRSRFTTASPLASWLLSPPTFATKGPY